MDGYSSAYNAISTGHPDPSQSSADPQVTKEMQSQLAELESVIVERQTSSTINQGSTRSNDCLPAQDQSSHALTTSPPSTTHSDAFSKSEMPSSKLSHKREESRGRSKTRGREREQMESDLENSESTASRSQAKSLDKSSKRSRSRGRRRGSRSRPRSRSRSSSSSGSDTNGSKHAAKIREAMGSEDPYEALSQMGQHIGGLENHSRQMARALQELLPKQQSLPEGWSVVASATVNPTQVSDIARATGGTGF